MKVLMLGWEFPPYFAGGLGIACHGLTTHLVKKGIDVTFFLPVAPDKAVDGVQLKGVSPHLKMRPLYTLLFAYATSSSYTLQSSHYKNLGYIHFGSSLFEEVLRYAEAAKRLALQESFDVIHAHDWLTYLAGVSIKQATGKPLVVHVHATAYDQAGGRQSKKGDQYAIEKYGLEEADAIIAVSAYTKKILVQEYRIAPSKITVVYNALPADRASPISLDKPYQKIVLFYGRLTLQKGPEQFLLAAQKVLKINPYVLFVVAGTGDLQPYILQKAVELGIIGHVLFEGFVARQDVPRLFALADVLVCPSLSEPFGLVPLEALHYGTPLILSKQSGVSEIIHHCLKIDALDVHDIANKILGVLTYKQLHKVLHVNGQKEIQKLTWEKPAAQCLDVYTRLTQRNYG
ncbi:glycosyltransferase family 4 protein [Candidatus Woesearchaeota archaeon]|nr:glycosyltransferase family 4 protein [Candidatus Woesearchaeota archaeon]